jgi:hypothetical protein
MRLAVALATLAAVNAAVTPKVERWANDPSDVLPPGTVTTKGTQFWLDHYPFYFNGANAYWLPQFVHDEGYIQTFEELKTLGVKVLRTWAFSTVTEIPTNNETYYQYWVNGTSL